MSKVACPRPWGRCWRVWVGEAGLRGGEDPPAISTASEELVWPPGEGGACVQGAARAVVLTPCPAPPGRHPRCGRCARGRGAHSPCGWGPACFCLPAAGLVRPGPPAISARTGTRAHAGRGARARVHTPACTYAMCTHVRVHRHARRPPPPSSQTRCAITVRGGSLVWAGAGRGRLRGGQVVLGGRAWEDLAPGGGGERGRG